MIQDLTLSWRHACRFVGLSRDSYRNPPQRDLYYRTVDIAHVRGRFSYQRIHDMLRPDFLHLNRNWVVIGP